MAETHFSGVSKCQNTKNNIHLTERITSINMIDKTYEDFYDLFDLNRNSENIEDDVEEKLDKIRNLEDDVEFLRATRAVKNVLIDEEERKIYNRIGHTEYVNKKFNNSEIEKINFETETKNDVQKTSKNIENMEDMISFDSDYSKEDPTVKASKKILENKDNSENSESVRKGERINNIITDSEDGKNMEESNNLNQESKFGSVLVDIISIVTNKYAKISMISLVIIGLVYIVYVNFGVLGAFFALTSMIISVYITKYIFERVF